MGKLNRLKPLLTGLMVLLLSVTAASAFSDTQGHPSEAAINKWSTEYGLISGYGDGTFHPNDSITKGAFASILDRMMHFRAKSPASTFRDVAGNQWEDAILKLHANAIYIAENGYAEPFAPVTRQQAVTMIARTFDFAADSILPHYIDDASIAGYAQAPVSEMAERGYLEGVADSYFRPKDPITRADVVRIFDNIISVMVITQTPLSQNVTGNVLVSSQGGATLRDMYITGDLYIAPGVISTVLLDNVTLVGETRNFSRAASVETRSTSAPPVLPEEEPEQRPPAPTVPAAPGSTPDSGNTSMDDGETTANPVVRPPAPSDSGRTSIDDGETTKDPGRTSDSGKSTDSGDPGNTPGSGQTSDSGKTAVDNGETTAPRPVTPENPENQVPIDTPATPENPENQLPTNTPTPSTPVTPYIPTNPDFGLPTKPVSQWTIRDVYTPGRTTGQYFTYQGNRIPVYAGVRARNVYAGDFVWRTGHRLRYVGGRYDAKFGVDVSAYQNRDRANGTINWKAAKADGVQFAMVRVGLRGTSTGALRADAYYAQNIDGAMAQGIQTGVYIFAQAVTIAEAVEEADFVISLLRGHKINGPVSYDWEMQDSSYRVYGTSPEMATACAVAFCKRVAAAGYTPMVYNSRYVCYIKYDQGALAPYMMWYPQYPGTDVDYPYPNLYYQMDYWQYTDSAVVEGIGRKIDANIWFKAK